MTQKEKSLFKNLCSFKNEGFDITLIEAATPQVLGHLFFNRMQAIAYGKLESAGVLAKVNREFRNSLKDAYDANVEKNDSYFRCVHYVDDILSQCKGKYAMLKGALLCRLYPKGYRTSNDIDILVLPQDVTEIGEILIKNGFVQGNVRGGCFKPATRREIIESKMMRGETVPYVKEINLPRMKYLEIDINFSLDYKTGDIDAVSRMIEKSETREIEGLRIQTLNKEDFFLHLCCHLYKEATTLPWVEMNRDMTLYKYCDIYMLMNGADENETKALFAKAESMGMDKICSFAIMQMAELFLLDNLCARQLAEQKLKNAPEFIHKVISPKDKKEFVYLEKDISERLFSENRKKLLQEVKENGTIKNEK